MARDPFQDPEALIRRVYAYVAYRVGHGPEAEDITSETFERALRYRDSYERGRGGPTAWLVGIARRCIADAAARPRTSSLSESDGVAAAGDVEQETAERLAVQAAVAALDGRDRELIALRYGADLSTAEIARVLELQANAVDVALHRARARLRARMESAETSTSAAETGSPALG